MPGETVIEARGLTRVYHTGEVEVRALRGVDIVVERGDFVAIMGPSGSGKSTTMNILGCLDRPTGGSYVLDGVEVSSLSRDDLAGIRNRKIGFVFQGFNLLARTSALENVELPMLYAGEASARERVERATAALTAVGLGKRTHHVPTQMSGGEQQRVAIARALVNRPAILLADEPTGNLDSRTSVEVMRILQDLNEREALTIILVTHEPDIAQYARRIITFRDGRIRSDVAVTNRVSAAATLETMSLEVDA
ncbi:MAG: ABC transporter ATP-binding protein [Proteobacteria bacterium]|nr:ABC transporter ATP-binding protein [Pseudomonadota bacterium]